MTDDLAAARDGAAPDLTPDELAQTAADLRLVLARILRRLRAVGDAVLSASQLSALATLDEHGPLRLRDLARQEGVRPPTATRVVDSLAERELVVRTPDPDDARGTFVGLTDAGRAQLGRTRDDRTAELAEALAHLPAAHARQLQAAVPLLGLLLAQMHHLPAGDSPP